MNKDDHQRLRAAYDELLELEQQEQRRRMAEMELSPAVRARLEALLEHEPQLDYLQDDAPGLLEEMLKTPPPASAPPLPAAPAEEILPERIGEFRIRGVLGRGGMGVVYRGQQERPEREVAVKVLNSLSATPDRLRRFEFEAEILARLDHPYVAKVFQTGVDAELGGLPYLAMELVEGRDILAHADALELSTRDRLELFRCVCEGVEHAHQHGIVHRDLKPANILVSRDGRPRILDFGIARPAERDDTTPGQTRSGNVLGSLHWMSPEQAEGDLARIGTRTDVYALGVLLYRLLSGQMPYAIEDLRPWEAARAILEQDPRRLTRVRPDLASDLEAICNMALEKDPDRRYPSAGAFGRDVGRFLDHVPVEAQPWSATYHVRKFARRHRGYVIAGAVVVGVAFAGLIATNVVQSRANEELRNKNQLLDEARRGAELAADEANLQAAIAEEVTQFLNEDLLAAIGPSIEQGRGHDVRLLEVFEVAAQRIEEAALPGGRFAERPLVEAKIRRTIGSGFFALGRLDEAEQHGRRALALLLEHREGPHEDTYRAHSLQASILRVRGANDEAYEQLQHALSIATELYGARSVEVYGLRTRAASLKVVMAGRREEAFEELEAEYAQLLADVHEELGPTHTVSLDALSGRAYLAQARGLMEDAERWYQQCLTLQRQSLGGRNSQTLDTMFHLSAVHSSLGNFERAEGLLQECIEGSRETLGESHGKLFRAMSSLGRLYIRYDRLPLALPLLEAALEGHRARGAVDSQAYRDSLRDLYSLHIVEERFDEAEPMILEGLEWERTHLGERHPDTLLTEGDLASLYAGRGEVERAEEAMLANLEAMREVYGPEHASTLGTLNNLAFLYSENERWEEAADTHSETLDLRSEHLGERHVQTLRSMVNLAACLNELELFEEAIQLYEEALRLRREEYGDDHPDMLTNHIEVAKIYAAQGRYEDAAPHQRAVVEINRALGLRDRMAVRDLFRLGLSLGRIGRSEEALGVLLEARDLAMDVLELDHRDQTLAYLNVSRTLLNLNRPQEALDVALELRAILPPNSPNLPTADDLIAEVNARLEADGAEANSP